MIIWAKTFWHFCGGVKKEKPFSVVTGWYVHILFSKRSQLEKNLKYLYTLYSLYKIWLEKMQERLESQVLHLLKTWNRSKRRCRHYIFSITIQKYNLSKDFLLNDVKMFKTKWKFPRCTEHWGVITFAVGHRRPHTVTCPGSQERASDSTIFLTVVRNSKAFGTTCTQLAILIICLG